MVSTRRSAANANRVLGDTKEPKGTVPPSDTTHVKKRPTKAKLTLNVPKSPVFPPVSVFSGNTSDHDIDLNSPTVDSVSKAPRTKTRGSKNPPATLSDRKISEPQRPVPKFLGSMSGSCQDPIVVNENSSPPRPTIRPPKRRHPDGQSMEPHRFVSKGCRNLYNYAASRPALARLPPMRSTHNSHQSHDVYKAMREIRAAEPQFNHHVFQGGVVQAFPFQVQYPLLAQPLEYQHVRPSFPSPYAQYYQYPAPPVQYYTITSRSEDMLRKEAARYIQEFSRTSSHKQTLSTTNAHEKKSGEAEQHDSHHGFSKDDSRENLTIDPFSSSQIGTYQRGSPTVSQDLQSNLNLNSLTKHTSLLTSLLQIYLYSSDQKGLLEDIRAISSIQTQHMASWLDSIPQGLPSRKERSNDNATDLGTKPISTGNLQTAALNEKDTELRQVFAATAAMWQDDTGCGVADVFRAQPSSPPTPSVNTSPIQPTSNLIEQSEGTEKAVTTPVTATPRMRAQRAGTQPARSTISPTPSSRYSPIVKMSDSFPGD